MRNFILLLFSAAAFGQAASDGISASASRTVTFAPDEAAFVLTVTTTLDLSQQQVMDALANAGIPAGDLAALGTAPDYSYPQLPPTTGLAYGFTFTVPIARMKTTLQQLTALRRNPPEGFLSVAFSASAGASQAAIEQAHQRVIPQLIAEARKKAEFLASAAGLKLGGVQALSEGGYGAYGLPVAGSFSGFLLGVPSSGGGVQATFSVSVKFGAQ